MKLFKKIFSIIMAGAFVLGTSVFSTSCKNIDNENLENASLISNEMGGGGGTPSIDEPDGEKSKVFPQPEVQDIIIPDEDKVSWNDAITDYINEQKEIDENFTYTLNGTGTASDPYQISSAMDLAYLAYYSNNVQNEFLTNKYISFTKDIYLNDGYFDEDGTYHDGGDGKLLEWTTAMYPGGTSGETVLGNGHTIYGCYVNDVSIDAALLFTVNRTYNAIKKIDRLNVDNIYVNAKTYGLSRLSVKTLSNCKSLKGNITCYSSGACLPGGEVITNCVNYTNGKSTTLLFSAFGSVSVKISNCVNHGNFFSNGGGATNAAGITNWASGDNVIIENCVNKGNVTARNTSAAGIVSRVDGNVVITNCANYGTIDSSGHADAIVSLVQDIQKNLEINDCKNYGKLIGNVVGFVGWVYYRSHDVTITMTGCYAENIPVVFVLLYGAAGAGKADRKVYITIENCIFDFSNISTGDSFITGDSNYSAGGGDILLRNVKIIAGSSNKYIYKSGLSHYNYKIINLLLESGINGQRLWTNGNPPVYCNGLLIIDHNIPKQYCGSNFVGFFSKWKTGEIGLTALEGVGLYQFALTEDWLQNYHHATKIVI